MNVAIQEDISKFARGEIIKFVEKWKTNSYIPLISTWAEENRDIPVGQSELPGLIDHSNAPHLVEIQDCLHPDSGISQITIMKGTQALVTSAIENAIGHSIKYKLHNILNIISSKNIAKIRSSAAIDVMIDNSGLSEYMKPMSSRMKRKIADGTFYKEMHGNRRLMMTSWNSISDGKSVSWSFIIMDELEEAPYELKGQGDPEAIFKGRSKTIRDLKIVKISTPTNTTGRINVNFLEGDQRYYYCKCPFCGERQVLKIKAGGRDFGLTARSERVDNVDVVIKDTVRYICKFCKKPIPEHQKGYMLNNGKWIPTATPVNPEYRSYQVSNLLSPISFYSWYQAMQDFAETGYGEK
ncbi:MAG: phage terminase large subunit family protein, partial [Thermodesulfobacteriota bacterium]|nr:phage terminase large subunit family protein [Thermodesulfobacteriota bacterium]